MEKMPCKFDPCRIQNYAPVKIVTLKRGRLVSLSLGVYYENGFFPTSTCCVYVCSYLDFPALLVRFSFVVFCVCFCIKLSTQTV